MAPTGVPAVTEIVRKASAHVAATFASRERGVVYVAWSVLPALEEAMAPYAHG